MLEDDRRARIVREAVDHLLQCLEQNIAIWYNIAYRLRGTQWLRYFAKNGVRTWADGPRFSGFREPHDSPDVFVGHWTGMTNTGEHYYAAVTVERRQLNAYTVEESRQRMVRAKSQSGREFLETFMDPKCRCRSGYHWKCGRHGRWCA